MINMELKAKNPARQEELEIFLRSEEYLRAKRGSPARYNIVQGRHYVTAIIPGTIQCTSCLQDLKLGDRVMIDKAQASHYTCPEVKP